MARRPGGRNPDAPPVTIGFRLTDDDRRGHLHQLAQAEGISDHEKARRIVEAALEGDPRDLERVRFEVSELRTTFENTQHGLAELFSIILHLLPNEKGERIERRAAAEFVASVFNGGNKGDA